MYYITGFFCNHSHIDNTQRRNLTFSFRTLAGQLNGGKIVVWYFMWVRVKVHTISNMESVFRFCLSYYTENTPFFFFLERKNQAFSLLLSKVKCYKCLLNLAWLLGEKAILRALEVSLSGRLLLQFQKKFNYKGKLDFSLECFLVIIFLM